MSESKKPRTTGTIFANALAGRFDYGRATSGGRHEVAAGMGNTLTCAHCGAARERKADGPLVCRYCGTPLTHAPSTASAAAGPNRGTGTEEEG